jgi:glycerol-3-phosphate acyltransferase PlsY
VFLGFHGGRGVGTGVGTMLVIQPLAVFLAAPVFVIVIVLTRYVSLGSLLGSATIPVVVAAWWLFAQGEVPLAYPLYATAGCALIWLAHADNIDRLLHGTERKFDLGLLGRDDPAKSGG